MPEPKGTPVEQIKRELERRSLDQVKVFNPTSKDRTCTWNMFIHRVPAGQYAIFPRYIAEKYARETVDYLIGQENTRRVAKENDRRLKAGMKEMDHQEREIFDLRTSDPALRASLLKEVYFGVTQEYGKDIPAMEAVETVSMKDQDVFSQIDAGIQAQRVEAIKITVDEETDTKKENVEKTLEEV